MTQTKLTEPVQVGLWYETKAGAIVKMDDVRYYEEDNPIFGANNGSVYNKDGQLHGHPKNRHRLIRCLGADPFKQVQPETITCPACNGNGGHRWIESCGSENGQQCVVCGGFGVVYKSDLEKAKQKHFPTQFERIFTAVLGARLTNPTAPANSPCGFVSEAIGITKEAIKQLKEKEIEGA